MKKLFVLVFLIFLTGCSSRPFIEAADVQKGQHLIYSNNLEWYLSEDENFMVGVTPLGYIDDNIMLFGIAVKSFSNYGKNLSINNLHFFVNGEKEKVLKKHEIIDRLDSEYTYRQIGLGIAGFLKVFGAALGNQQSFYGYSNGNYYSGSITSPATSQIAVNNAKVEHSNLVMGVSLTKEQKIAVLNKLYLEKVTVFPNDYQEGIVYLEKDGDFKEGDNLHILLLFGNTLHIYNYTMKKKKS